MTTVIYGIANCDTMKKARAWLDGRGIGYAFHDYRKLGIGRDRLEEWTGRVGWEALLNRAGTTFRKLPDEAKRNLDGDRAIALMLQQPSMIRRPVLTTEREIEVGFRPERYEALFG